MSVRLAVPNRGMVNTFTAERLEAIARANGLPPIHYERGPLTSADSRCKVVKWLMEETSDDVVMCDDSVVPPPNILGLAAHGLDIVAAPTFLTHEEVNTAFLNVYRWGQDEKGKWGSLPFDMQFTAKGLHEAHRVGTGCIFVSRRVFNAIHKAGKAPFFFPVDEWGVATSSEDFAFCDLVRELGFKIHADFDLVCEHFSTVGLWERHRGMVRAVVHAAVKMATTMPPQELARVKAGIDAEVEAEKAARSAKRIAGN